METEDPKASDCLSDGEGMYITRRNFLKPFILLVFTLHIGHDHAVTFFFSLCNHAVKLKKTLSFRLPPRPFLLSAPALLARNII